MANKSKAELLAEAREKGIAVSGDETRNELLDLLDESEDGSQNDVDVDEDKDVDVKASGAEIEGDEETDHVAVEHFHPFLRHGVHRVFSKSVHGDNFKDLAKEFSKTNPWPAMNSAGLVMPAGSKAQPVRENRVFFVSESEGRALTEETASKFAAIDARREEQRKKGHKVTP